MSRNLTNFEGVKFIPITEVINLARNGPDQDRAKHIIFTVLSFFTRLVENSDDEQQLLWDLIVEKGWY